jgi:hypothetical protein
MDEEIKPQRKEFRRCKCCENYYIKSKSDHVCDDCYPLCVDDKPLYAKPKRNEG